MLNEIPDFSNIRFDKTNLQNFLGDSVNTDDKNKLNSLFDKCNLTDQNGEIDDVLTGEERTNFLEAVKQQCKDIFDKVVDFFTAVETVEELRERTNETQE